MDAKTQMGQGGLSQRTAVTIVAALSTLLGCAEATKDSVRPDTSDVVAPGAVDDLQLESRSDNWISLRWTSPGDDEDTGYAWRYDVRQSTDPITEQTWGDAEQLTGEPAPFAPGRRQVFTIVNQDIGKTFYFAIRTLDESGNLSGLSNVLEVDDLLHGDEDAPGQVEDLRIAVVTPHSIELEWSATGADGDEGIAAGYEIRYHRVPLHQSNFRDGTLLLETPVPSVAGEEQSWIVGDLIPGVEYYLGIRVWDDHSNHGLVSNIVRATTRVG